MTGRTFTGEHILSTDVKKQIVLDQLKKAREKLDIKIIAYSILSNHHHGVYYVQFGTDIAKIMQYLHGGSTRRLNKINEIQKSNWDGYWDVWIRNEDMLWKLIGYVIGNPLKHKIVGNFKELERYRFSSYKHMVKMRGKKFANTLVESVIQLDFETKSKCESYFQEH